MNELLTTAWLDGTVFDQIQLAITPTVLPYHVHSFEVAQMLIYFMDVCIDDPTKCDQINQYKDYCYANYASVLSDELSLNEFIVSWPNQVSADLGVPLTPLLNLYDRDLDTYNSNRALRDIFDYALAKGINGTPSVFINGVMLDSTPNTVNQWINHLNTVYESQYSHNNVQGVRVQDL